MRVRRKQYKEAEVIIYSIIDIAFLLLIFFILTTTLAKTAGSKLTIPSGVSDPSRSEEKQITVNLKSSDIYFGERGDRLTLEEFRARLQAENFFARDPAKRIIVLDSTSDVPYEVYFQVVTAIARAGGVVALVDRSEEAEAER
jgi:biopolymer transport protein ExbD